MSINMRMKRTPLLAAGAAALLLSSCLFLLSSCSFLPKEEEVLVPPLKEPQKIAYETVETVKGTIENKIYCTGNFISYIHKDLFFVSRNGRLKEIYVKLGDTVKKGDLIAELDTGSLMDSIALEQYQLKRIQINYNRIKAQSDLVSGEKYDLELVTLDLEMEKLKLNQLYAELDKAKIVSPIDGEISYVKELKQQDNVNANEIIASVADPKALQLQYSGDKVPSFKLGMKVNTVLGKKDYEGIVVATPMEAPADADEETKKSIWINIDGLPDSTGLGSSAIFSLLLEKRDNVIALPISAINVSGTRKYVNVLQDGIREERDVELGIITDTEVEIVKGLDVGEIVILR